MSPVFCYFLLRESFGGQWSGVVELAQRRAVNADIAGSSPAPGASSFRAQSCAYPVATESAPPVARSLALPHERVLTPQTGFRATFVGAPKIWTILHPVEFILSNDRMTGLA